MKEIIAFGFLISLIAMAPGAMAQPQLPGPGITPDSPFYFLDKAFDRFQPTEAVADERVAEIKAMAERNNSEAMERATEGYQQVMRERQREGNMSEGAAEEVARQASNHMSVLSEVRQEVPEQAQRGIDRAINNSVRGRETALRSLYRRNQERAVSVAESTLEEVMANAPEQARQGLERAMEAVSKRGPPEGAGPGQPGVGENETGQNEEGEVVNVTEGQPTEENNTTGEQTSEQPENGTQINQTPEGQ